MSARVFGGITYAIHTGNIADLEQLVAERHRLPHPAGDTLMNMAQYLEEKGKTEAKRATALNLLKEGADTDFVARVTGLTLEEVKELVSSSAD